MVKLSGIFELISNIQRKLEQLEWAKYHIQKVVKENRTFTKEEIECLEADGLLEEHK
jgi:hypothetical protein